MMGPLAIDPMQESVPYADEEIEELWRKYFDAKDLESTIRRIAEQESPERLAVAWTDLEEFDVQMAEEFVDHPDRYMAHAQRAAMDYMPQFHEKFIRVVVNGMPSSMYDMNITGIRDKDLRKYRRIVGNVRMVQSACPRYTHIVFECPACHVELPVKQGADSSKKTPPECKPADLGGCERKFKGALQPIAVLEKSTADNLQVITIQQQADSDSGRQRSEKIDVHLTDDMVDLIKPGENATIHGVVRAELINKKSTKTRLYFDGLYIEPTDDVFGNRGLSPEDYDVIEEMRNNPHIIDDFADSLAPSIQGMGIIKQAIALQMFGGVTIERDDIRVRGDIHMLLVGDPGTAKSKLLEAANRMDPRSMFIAGTNASAVGLTATVRQLPEDDGGGWVVEAGAMPLCDRSTAIIDELEKAGKREQESLLIPMETQRTPVNKGDVHEELMSRTSVLAAGNPKGGKFKRSEYQSYMKQLDIIPPLFDRFDAIFVILDEIDKDREKVEHMRRVRGVALGQQKAGSDTESKYSRRHMRAYITNAREHFKPQMSDDVSKQIDQWWTSHRKHFVDDENISISTRAWESVNRFAEASARARMSNKVSMDDVKLAITITETWIRQFTQDQPGSLQAVYAVESEKDHKLNDAAVMRAFHELAGDPHTSKQDSYSMKDIINSSEMSAVDTRRAVSSLAGRGLLQTQSGTVDGEKRYKKFA